MAGDSFLKGTGGLTRFLGKCLGRVKGVNNLLPWLKPQSTQGRGLVLELARGWTPEGLSQPKWFHVL